MEEGFTLIQYSNSGRIAIEDCKILVDYAVEIMLVERSSYDSLGFRVSGEKEIDIAILNRVFQLLDIHLSPKYS